MTETVTQLFYADADVLAKKLRDPFPPHLVRWLPKAKTSNEGRRPCVPYVEFATVVDRLDQVVGVGGWQSQIEVLNDGAALCELKLRIGAGWIAKADVGAVGAKEDGSSRVKAAASDALKRAAAKFGVGAYLVHVPRQWLDYDDQRKRVIGVAHLPAWAMPGGEGHPPAPPVDAKLATSIGNAIATAFQKATDATSFSVARLAYLQAWSGGRIGPPQRAVILGSRSQAASRLSLNDPHAEEE